ncbi:hypothetical protein H2204_011726 [Knufia peltigerae]|uniref:Acriflavine sensitivity control protein acr-2 n=1 Tax=Knufia peltigerae TaxID=1002370 RepID=A0AA38XTS3_9EURO|nr:hypothetical protein H2204_011726 [Knufia peltigerae]
MSNASQKLLSTSTPSAFPHRRLPGQLSSACLKFSAIERLNSYHDALAAKQQALSLLQSGIVSVSSADVDVTLAVVLLFIELELIDSGRDHWKYHIKGARTMIETLIGTNALTRQTAMSPLRRSLIANCLVFDIIGSALSAPIVHDSPREQFPIANLSLLQDAEGNHCSSFPTFLLQLLRSGSALSLPSNSSSSSSPSSPLIDARIQQQKQKQQLLSLLSAARDFEPLVWATNVQPHSPAHDLQYRTHIASAHRAGVCIYLSRVLLSLCPSISTTQLPQDLDSLVGDIITHLSFIPKEHALFKAATWPAFIAGAETNDRERQDWVVRRFEELWDVEPWGLIKGALGVLLKIWSNRMTNVVDGDKVNVRAEKLEHSNWIQDLRGRGVDWLVI